MSNVTSPKVKTFILGIPVRLIVVILLAILELGLTAVLLNYFYTQFAWVETILRLVSLVIVFTILRYSRHLSSDISWMLVIMMAPIAGTALYLLLGANFLMGRTFHSIQRETASSEEYFEQDPAVMERLEASAPEYLGQFNYLLNDACFPTYDHTDTTYYELGELGYPHMLEDLERAERFIFVEYFIIEPGIFWDSIIDVLERKAAEGLDVRVLYDDIGSVATVPQNYAKALQERGIKCETFNRLNVVMSVFVNHRDHRKIMLIDGKVGYTGGINLADEYINACEKFGHWKDNVLRVSGDAVWTFTVLFLTTWNALRHEDDDYRAFRAEVERLPEGDTELDRAAGFVAPYGETPLDEKLVGQNVYINIISQARRYCYIFTPYLIIDTDMRNALILAAQRGVDVRIVTPGVPDKKIIWDVTRSHYRQLIEGGAHVLEYTPGFVHAKVFVCDDQIATVGTLNLDYRSLYLHFENGVLMCNTPAVLEVRDDCLATLESCHEMTVKESTFGPILETLLTATRLVTPLL